eukprot:m.10310 g.10310  ORF g.10310 m.10310 type:complete len:90 (+) comp7386_c0_seq1:460-729(+)
MSQSFDRSSASHHTAAPDICVANSCYCPAFLRKSRGAIVNWTCSWGTSQCCVPRVLVTSVNAMGSPGKKALEPPLAFPFTPANTQGSPF